MALILFAIVIAILVSNMKFFSVITMNAFNGLIQVRLKDGLVQDFQDIGYGLYLFAPEMLSFNLEKIIRPTKRLPVIVSNVEKLPEVLKEIRKVSKWIIDQWMEKWYVYPFGFRKKLVVLLTNEKTILLVLNPDSNKRPHTRRL